MMNRAERRREAKAEAKKHGEFPGDPACPECGGHIEDLGFTVPADEVEFDGKGYLWTGPPATKGVEHA